MLSSEITIGGRYVVRIGARPVAVHVLDVEDVYNPSSGVWGRRWKCRSELTGKPLVVRSARRFRCRAPEPVEADVPLPRSCGWFPTWAGRSGLK